MGSYQTTFELPDEWRGRRVLLEFDGIGPAATVWLNGREVGYTQDWALPAEFELTGLLAASTGRRRHVLSVQVLRWCDGCYLEGQDHWWLSGIHRHVRLYSKPSALAICDYSACTTCVATDGASAALAVTVRLSGLAAHDATGDSAAAVAASGAAPGAGPAPAVLARHRVRASLHGPYELSLGAPPPDAPEVWRSASGVLPVEGGTSSEDGEGGLLCGGAQACFEATVARPRLWTAEAPALYTLVLELLLDPACDGSSGDDSGDGSSGGGGGGGGGSGSGSGSGSGGGGGGGGEAGTAAAATVDVEACRVGLRVVSISGEQLRVNGVPLEVRGVNRHEHSAERGKAPSWTLTLTPTPTLTLTPTLTPTPAPTTTPTPTLTLTPTLTPTPAPTTTPTPTLTLSLTRRSAGRRW